MKGWTFQGSLAPARASIEAGAFEDASTGRCSAGEGGAELYAALVARGHQSTDELARKASRLAARAAVASLAFVVTNENGTVAADILQGERGPPVRTAVHAANSSRPLTGFMLGSYRQSHDMHRAEAGQ